MAKVLKVTKEKLEEMKQELDYLKTTRNDEVAEQIKIARGYGDLSENAEYDEARNEQAKVEARIMELEALIENAEIIEEAAGSEDVVSYGSKIVIRFEDDDDEEEYTIVGTREVDPAEGKISDESPIGKAVMKHRAGDVVTVEAPSGRLNCTIVSVTR